MKGIVDGAKVATTSRPKDRQTLKCDLLARFFGEIDKLEISIDEIANIYRNKHKQQKVNKI